MRRQILTGKFPTERLPNPENGQRHGYSDLGDHVVAFPNPPEAAPILVVAMNTFQPLGICPICGIGADGYIRGQQGVWALCQHCRCRWRTDYSLPSWIPQRPEEPALWEGFMKRPDPPWSSGPGSDTKQRVAGEHSLTRSEAGRASSSSPSNASTQHAAAPLRIVTARLNDRVLCRSPWSFVICCPRRMGVTRSARRGRRNLARRRDGRRFVPSRGAPLPFRQGRRATAWNSSGNPDRRNPHFVKRADGRFDAFTAEGKLMGRFTTRIEATLSIPASSISPARGAR
jgi:hypothetical protein